MFIRTVSRFTMLVAAVGLLSLPATAKEKTTDLSGPAPDFTLKSLDGKNIRLSELRGQVVMLNFWASWCGPCKQEMPLLDALYKRYQPAGFTLLGINAEEDITDAKKLLAKDPVAFPVLLDTDSKMSETYGVDAMPSTVLIDCDGNLRHLHRSYVPGDEKKYKKMIKSLLRECS